VGNQDSFP
jgi:hypothetical protein